MTLVTQGLGSFQSGVVVTQGYGDDWGGGPPPPPAVQRPVARAPTGGSGVYDIEIPEFQLERPLEEGEVAELEPFFDGEKIDFRPAIKKKKPELDILDIEPLRLQELLREGRELDTRLDAKLRRLDERERELSEMEKRVLAEMKALQEQSAISMRDKEEAIDAKSLFRGGMVIPLHKIRPEAVYIEEQKVALWDDFLVPLSIGFGIGAGLTAAGVALIKLWQYLTDPERKRPKKNMNDDSSEKRDGE